MWKESIKENRVWGDIKLRLILGYKFRSVCQILTILTPHVFLSLTLPLKSVGRLYKSDSEEGLHSHITSVQVRVKLC